MSGALPEARIPLAHPSAPATADFARNPRRLMLSELLFMFASFAFGDTISIPDLSV